MFGLIYSIPDKQLRSYHQYLLLRISRVVTINTRILLMQVEKYNHFDPKKIGELHLDALFLVIQIPKVLNLFSFSLQIHVNKSNPVLVLCREYKYYLVVIWFNLQTFPNFHLYLMVSCQITPYTLLCLCIICICGMALPSLTGVA